MTALSVLLADLGKEKFFYYQGISIDMLDIVQKIMKTRDEVVVSELETW